MLCRHVSSFKTRKQEEKVGIAQKENKQVSGPTQLKLELITQLVHQH